jgi:mannose-1-phosphate guanylyltransferase
VNLKAVIMAGGSGTRFWPLSRQSRPKQFLPIASDKTMFEETVERLLPLIPHKNILTVSSPVQARQIRRLQPALPAANVLAEPQPKNTAPSLMLATAHLYLRDPETVVAALCADHIIRERKKFLKKLSAAAAVAAKDDVVVTFGVPPSFPATGYGYIHFSRAGSSRLKGESFHPVREFKEKPGRRLAQEFLAAGDHYWNSGMFVWRAGVFAEKLEKYAPSLFPFWQRILKALRTKNTAGTAAVFRDMPSISIDYALMEKAEGVVMNEGKFGWSDAGAWSSLAELWPKDSAGNALRGKGILIDSRNCLVHSPRRLAALVGLKDIIVVDTDDALLVCHAGHDQKVKDVLEILKKKGRDKYL